MGVYDTSQSLADLHIHTRASNDARDGMEAEQAVELAEKIEIDTIAITDHDTFESSRRAWNYAQRRNSSVSVIPRMEISSRDGHVLGLFLREEVAKNMPLDQTIAVIHDQGGLAIIPHPEFLPIPSVKKDLVLHLVSHPQKEFHPDGFEIMNGGVFDYAMRKMVRGRKFPTMANQESYAFYRDNSDFLGAPIASSDAHRKTFGRFVTGYEGDLRSAIKDRKTVALARSLEEVEEIIGASSAIFGDGFDSEQIRAWIDLIKNHEDQYFSYLDQQR